MSVHNAKKINIRVSVCKVQGDDYQTPERVLPLFANMSDFPVSLYTVLPHILQIILVFSPPSTCSFLLARFDITLRYPYITQKNTI